MAPQRLYWLGVAVCLVGGSFAGNGVAGLLFGRAVNRTNVWVTVAGVLVFLIGALLARRSRSAAAEPHERT